MNRDDVPTSRDTREESSRPDLPAVSDDFASDASARGKPSASLWLACIVFIVLGLLGTYALVVLPIAHTVEGRSWVRTPCRVSDCSVRRHRGRFFPTYSVDIAYEYDVEGRKYRSDRWDFFPVMPGIGRDRATAVARLHPPGRMLECYVNPLDPSKAVLDRRIQSGFPRILLPLAFLAAGLAMVYPLACTRQPDPATPAVPHQAMADEANSSPGWRGVLTALGLAVFLNGSAYVLGHILLDEWREGQVRVDLTILVVFVGVMGVVMIGVLLRVLLRCLSPWR